MHKMPIRNIFPSIVAKEKFTNSFLIIKYFIAAKIREKCAKDSVTVVENS